MRRTASRMEERTKPVATGTMARIRMAATGTTLLAALAAACGDPAARPDAVEQQTPSAPAMNRSEAVAKLGYDDGASGAAAAPSVSAEPDATPFAPDRKIIRDVRLEIEVEEIEAARAGAGRVAVELGGFLSDVGFQDLASDRPRGQMTLRVPTERTEAAVAALGELGDLRAETLSSQDVTRQYLDAETRLRVLRETDARLRRILADRTGDLADVLQVERELSRVVTQIEQLEGQRRFWDEQVDLATIHLSLFAPAPVVAAGWFDPVREAFGGSLGILARSVALLVTALAAALPFAAVGLVVWLVWRAALRVASTRAAP